MEDPRLKSKANCMNCSFYNTLLPVGVSLLVVMGMAFFPSEYEQQSIDHHLYETVSWHSLSVLVEVTCKPENSTG